MVTGVLWQPSGSTLGVPLFCLGAAAFIGYGLMQEATAEKFVRDGYVDRYSCECDYRDACVYEKGRWYGPWSAENVQATRPTYLDDRCPSEHHTGSGGSYVYRPGYRAPQVQNGYRGGFGSTGDAIRSAGT